MKRFRSLCALFSLVAVAACAEGEPVTSPTEFQQESVSAARASATTDAAVGEAIEAAVRELGIELAARHGSAEMMLEGAFWMGNPDEQAMGGTVFFNDRGNKQLPVQWVPGDPRRFGRTNLKYVSVPSAPAGLTPADIDGAIDRAMATWNGTSCSSGLSIDETSPADPDADIVHLGFSPLPPGVLGVTFPFIWVQGGVPTDIDNDGNFDYALALILYNSDFPWTIDGNIDVETVALHEAGHGLGQAHFGKAFANRGGLHFAPRAVMNAAYSGVQQSITATDNGGHCSMFGSWPNN